MGLQIDRTTPAQTPAVRNGINRYNFLGKETQVATAAADLTLVATMGSGSTNPGNLISKTSAESQTVTAIKETVELRHYTSNKGLEGIKKDMEIKAYDQNKVFEVAPKNGTHFCTS